MKKMSTSKDRFSFQKESYLKRMAENGKTPETDSDVSAMMDFFESSKKIKEDQEQSLEWQKNNMEHDLRTASWILEKVRSSETYSQNLYAAMCNNEFLKILDEEAPETIDKILKNDIPTWSCSWRYAGGIVADMREKGDYIDWYCSGIRNTGDDNECIDTNYDDRKYVAESVVTDEIRADLLNLGWRVQEYDDSTI